MKKATGNLLEQSCEKDALDYLSEDELKVIIGGNIATDDCDKGMYIASCDEAS